MIDVAVLFGADQDQATLELKEALEFEMKITNVSSRNKLQVTAKLIA